MSRASVPWSIKSNLVQTANVLFPVQEEVRFVTTALQIKLSDSAGLMDFL